MATSWEYLLGGYATNTLTDEEKRQLYKAALNDQVLFDVLADEEALKTMLADPEARRRILASLEAAERSRGVSDGYGKWVSWFKEHTSLAWGGEYCCRWSGFNLWLANGKRIGAGGQSGAASREILIKSGARIAGTETFG